MCWVSMETTGCFSKPFFACLDSTLGCCNEHPEYNVFKSSLCDAAHHFGQTGGARGDEARLFGLLPHGSSSFVFVSCCFCSFSRSSLPTSISIHVLSLLLKLTCTFFFFYVNPHSKNSFTQQNGETIGLFTTWLGIEYSRNG